MSERVELATAASTQATQGAGRAQRQRAPDDQARGLRMAETLVAIASGKGGVGKSSLAANLGVAAASLGARVLVMDGDLGLANIDVLLGLTPLRTSADVMEGRCTLEEAVCLGPRGLHLLAAGSGRGDRAALYAAHREQRERLLLLLREAESAYDLVLVDVGSGIGPLPIALATACTRVLLVLSPEPTSLSDAYAMCKVSWLQSPGLPIDVVVNGARSEGEGRAAFARLAKMVRRFMRRGVTLRCVLLDDDRARDAVARQRAVVELYPTAGLSRRITGLASELVRRQPPAPQLGELGELDELGHGLDELS